MYFAYKYTPAACVGNGCKNSEPFNVNNYYLCSACSRNVNARSIQTTLEGMDVQRFVSAKRLKVSPPLPASKDLIKQQTKFKSLGGCIKAHSRAPEPVCPTRCCFRGIPYDNT